jgi:hypothetical protein
MIWSARLWGMLKSSLNVIARTRRERSNLYLVGLYKSKIASLRSQWR